MRTLSGAGAALAVTLHCPIEQAQGADARASVWYKPCCRMVGVTMLLHLLTAVSIFHAGHWAHGDMIACQGRDDWEQIDDVLFFMCVMRDLALSPELAAQDCLNGPGEHYQLPHLNRQKKSYGIAELISQCNCGNSAVFWLGLRREEPLANEILDDAAWMDATKWRWFGTNETTAVGDQDKFLPWREAPEKDSNESQRETKRCAVAVWEHGDRHMYRMAVPCNLASSEDVRGNSTTLLVCQWRNDSRNNDGGAIKDPPIPDPVPEKWSWQWMVLGLSLAIAVLCVTLMSVICVMLRRSQRIANSEEMQRGRRSSSPEKSSGRGDVSIRSTDTIPSSWVVFGHKSRPRKSRKQTSPPSSSSSRKNMSASSPVVRNMEKGNASNGKAQPPKSTRPKWFGLGYNRPKTPTVASQR